MILDALKNKNHYVNAHPLFGRAFAFVEEYLKNPVEVGNYEIYGQDLFVKVQTYETKEEGLLEVHDKYIDIQCMVKGEEKVGYTGRQGLEAATAYDEEGDIQFFKDGEECAEFTLKEGDFAIFFPEDAHKPSLAVKEKANVTKLVFKVRV